MAIEPKVVWSEGIFITPQHFQQFDRYIESGLRQLSILREGFYWGFTALELDTSGLKQGVIAGKGGRLNDIVPINADDLAIYQLKEEDGTIELLDSYEGIPSDENFLNNEIGRTNELFADLLDLQ